MYIFICVFLILLAIWHIVEIYRKRMVINKMEKITIKLNNKYKEDLGPKNSRKIIDIIIKDAIHEANKGTTRMIKI